MSDSSGNNKILTPLEMIDQGLEWVPPCRYEKGYWRKAKSHSSKLKPSTMKRLTRPRTQAGSRPPGSSASGCWLKPGGGRFSTAKPKVKSIGSFYVPSKRLGQTSMQVCTNGVLVV